MFRSLLISVLFLAPLAAAVPEPVTTKVDQRYTLQPPTVAPDGRSYVPAHNVYSGYSASSGLFALDKSGHVEWFFQLDPIYDIKARAALGADGVIYLAAPLKYPAGLQRAALFAINPD